MRFPNAVPKCTKTRISVLFKSNSLFAWVQDFFLSLDFSTLLGLNGSHCFPRVTHGSCPCKAATTCTFPVNGDLIASQGWSMRCLLLQNSDFHRRRSVSKNDEKCRSKEINYIIEVEEYFAEIWTPVYNRISLNFKDLCILVTWQCLLEFVNLSMLSFPPCYISMDRELFPDDLIVFLPLPLFFSLKTLKKSGNKKFI